MIIYYKYNTNMWRMYLLKTKILSQGFSFLIKLLVIFFIISHDLSDTNKT